MNSEGPRYLIFLTNLGFITLNIYFITAAMSTTTKYLTVHLVRPLEQSIFERTDDYNIMQPSGCCGYGNNMITWYQVVHWILHVISIDLAFNIMILYWSLLYRGGSVDGVNINVHLLNGIVALIDLWVSGVPVNLLHLVYGMIIGVIYSLFTVIYFVISDDIVYTVLDYESELGSAIGTLFGVVFIFSPIVHILTFLQHLAKFCLLHCFFYKDQEQPEEQLEEKLTEVL